MSIRLAINYIIILWNFIRSSLSFSHNLTSNGEVDSENFKNAEKFLRLLEIIIGNSTEWNKTNMENSKNIGKTLKEILIKFYKKFYENCIKI